MLQEFISSWKNIFNFHGRTCRREYWLTDLWILSILLLGGSLCFLFGLIPTPEYTLMGIVCLIGMILFELVFFVTMICAVIVKISMSVRRCHDIGLSGWIYLLCQIGFFCGIGTIVWLVLCCLDSKEDNRWGENPKKADDNNSVGSIVLAIGVFVVSIILFTVLTIADGA